MKYQSLLLSFCFLMAPLSAFSETQVEPGGRYSVSQSILNRRLSDTEKEMPPAAPASRGREPGGRFSVSTELLAPTLHHLHASVGDWALIDSLPTVDGTNVTPGGEYIVTDLGKEPFNK